MIQVVNHFMTHKFNNKRHNWVRRKIPILFYLNTQLHKLVEFHLRKTKNISERVPKL